MSATVKVHGMDGDLVEPDWPPLTLAEVRALLEDFPGLGEPIEILSVSPRPLSAAGVVNTRGGRVFIKRHHRTVRDAEGLLEEHRFLAHLLAHGAPVPRVFASRRARQRSRWRVDVRGARNTARRGSVRGGDLVDAFPTVGARALCGPGAGAAASGFARFRRAATQAATARSQLHDLCRTRSQRRTGTLSGRAAGAWLECAVRESCRQALSCLRRFMRSFCRYSCSAAALDAQRSACLESLLERFERRCAGDRDHRLRPRRSHECRARSGQRHRAQHRRMARTRRRSRAS